MEYLCSDRENLNDFLEEAELQQYYELFRDILKVSKVSQLKFVLIEDLVQIGLSKPEQRRYKKIYSKYFPNPYITKIKKLLSAKKSDLNPNAPNSFPLEILPFSENIVKSPTKHIISIEDITINKELGMGQFGVVQQGTWTTGNQRLQVAIKCLGHERLTSNSTEFLKEAAVMHSIEHPNIVRLYGVVLHMDSLMLVTELAPLRSLLECLREVSFRSNFPVPNLCDFAEQICDGMTYLENKRLIHRDLAARNILVFSKDRVKISDFGLSRALGVGKDYYQTNYNVNLKLPVAWCAPECILYLRFTSSSDVWAFGVCLWEMFTYGFQPWAAFSGQQILEAIDTPNFQRLERPECCPEAYYTTMLECWSHDPTTRPKFKDLGPKLKEIRPDQVQAMSNFERPEEGRRPNMLEYKTGQIITVLGKESMTKSSLWYGVLSGGTCGMFDPSQTRPYVRVDKGSPLASLSPHPMRQSSRSIRSSLLRSDVKRHTYTGKRSIQRSMISSPQGDVKHTGHVGLDGAYFGDISFLDTAGQPPRQIVTPYKPSEDTEQQPLINPNSPSHLSRASGGAYSLFPTPGAQRNSDEVDLPYGNSKSKSQKKPSHKSVSEPTTSKKILNKVKSATLGRSHRAEDNAASKTDEVHEYHEISDTDTESNAADHQRMEHFTSPESPGIPKSYGDFGQSLLDEMESMFRNLDGRRKDEASGFGKHADGEVFKSHTLSKAEKKKQAFHTGTLKPMSAGEEKTLATAVALANELTTKSMNDLDGETKHPNSPSDRSKFPFKFPHFALHSTHHEPEKEAVGKQERRNFSEEANSVPDIQSIITEESKHAYSSLIEQPMTSSSVMSHGLHGASVTMPKPAPAPRVTRPHFHSLQKQLSQPAKPTVADSRPVATTTINELPLPPRNTKPKLVDKPRHVRKYPLRLPPTPAPEPTVRPIIYQNACTQVSFPMLCQSSLSGPQVPSTSKHSDSNGVDVCDGKDKKHATNPFTNVPSGSNAFATSSSAANNFKSEPSTSASFASEPNNFASGPSKFASEPSKFASGPSKANPFDCYLPEDDGLELDYPDGSDDDTDDALDDGLIKDCGDHVSVEDLLEFADQKPCGRQRGVESDEVRIMSKVLKEQVTPEECLQALELSEWNVHRAIKVIRIKIAVDTDVTLQNCSSELDKAGGDIVKASAALLLTKSEIKQ